MLRVLPPTPKDQLVGKRQLVLAGSVAILLLTVLFLGGCSATRASGATPSSTTPPASNSNSLGHRFLKLSPLPSSAPLGTPYDATIAVSGGTAPYTFSVSWGQLPPGLSLATSTGTVSGTPTKLGSWGFGIHVTDSSGEGGAATFDLNVQQGGVVTVTVSPATATVSSAGSLQLTAAVSNTSNSAVTWTASQGTISSSGLYLAPSVSITTSANVTATSVADPTKSATANLTITSSVQTSSADYYVAPSGSDSNPGTINLPFASIAKAQSMVRTVLLPKCGSRATPIVVQIRGGLYTSQSLNFTSSDSGCGSQAQVVYQNYPGETPIVSGGRQVTGWTNIAGSSICAGNSNCWQVTLPTSTPYFEALFYNGQRRFRPRLGATATNLLGKYYRIKSPVQTCSGNCYDRFVYNSSDPISQWSNLGGAYPKGDVELIDFEKWTTPLERIDHIDTNAKVIYLTGQTVGNKDHGYIANHRYIVENIKDLLQFPGQWFLDRSVSPWKLTYIANSGENPNNDLVMIPQNAQVLSATSLQWVTFQGIQFEHDNYVVPASGYASEQLDPAIPAMVHCSGCKNVTFESNVFTQSVGVGLDVVATSTNVTVSTNNFYDLGAYGIRFGTQPAQSDTDSTVAHNLIATDNGIASVGRFLPSSDGIVLGDVHDIELSYNEIYDSYHDGVEICKPSQGVCNGSKSSGTFNINVHDNSVHDVMQGVTDDGGCFYAMTAISGGSATGNKMTHNLCHDVSDASIQDSDGYGGHGIYLDSYTGLWDVQQNLIYRVSAVALNMSQGPQGNGQANTFANNITAYARQAIVGVLSCPPAPLLQFTFSNNLVYQDRSHSSSPVTNLQKTAVFTGGGSATQVQNFAGNVYWNAKESLASDSHAFSSSTGSSCSGGNWMAFNGWQSMGEDSGSAVQNPTFTNPTYPTDDFSLAHGSNATSTGFVPFSMTFGRTNPTPIPAVLATFPTLTFNPKTDF